MLIYKHYTQATLDHQYNNRLNAPDHEYHLQQWELVNRETEKKYKLQKNIPYGEGERETLDIFPSEKSIAKTLVFIHGGYWYKNGPFDVYLIAEAFRAYGITIVLISYPLMPEYSMDQLVLSCRKAIGWLHQNLSQYNGDPEQIYIAGHSAGGHLAAMMMATNWPEFDPSISAGTIKGICAISGLYNLLPVQLCYVNDTLKMDKETATRNSPVQLSPHKSCPLILAVGGEETAEYKEQSRELYDEWTAKGADVQYLEIADTNHFSVLTSLLDHSSVLHKTFFRMMNMEKS
jgi:arylformamidase